MLDGVRRSLVRSLAVVLAAERMRTRLLQHIDEHELARRGLARRNELPERPDGLACQRFSKLGACLIFNEVYVVVVCVALGTEVLQMKGIATAARRWVESACPLSGGLQGPNRALDQLARNRLFDKRKHPNRPVLSVWRASRDRLRAAAAAAQVGHCSLHHPKETQTIVLPPKRCSQCTLPWPCGHCAFTKERNRSRKLAVDVKASTYGKEVRADLAS